MSNFLHGLSHKRCLGKVESIQSVVNH